MNARLAHGLDRAYLEAELKRAWARSDRLFDLIEDEGWHECAILLRHPPIFYLGHLPAFAWNHIGRGVLQREPMDATFDELFERGIDPMSTQEAAAEAREDWPPRDAILAYRDRVREAVLASFPDVEARASDDVLCEGGRIYELVIEHELMHHETLLYILNQMPLDLLRRPADWPAPELDRDVPPAEWIAVPAGTATIGAAFESIPFGWDNEFPRHEVDVSAFRLTDRPVTNAEFLAFVEDGGYEADVHWSGEATVWRMARGMTAPHNWLERDGVWCVRTLFDEIPLDRVGAWPVHVSHAEAEAYCRWKSARLPTEAELHRAAYGTPDGLERTYPWGDEAPGRRHGNLDFSAGAPVPVGSRPEGRSAFGAHELVGNGWEWTSTPFAPLPGFEPYLRTYPGYSTDFFDDEHYVVFGGSWATDRKLLRPSFRNWYQGHYPYVFSTFRLARDGA